MTFDIRNMNLKQSLKISLFWDGENVSAWQALYSTETELNQIIFCF